MSSDNMFYTYYYKQGNKILIRYKSGNDPTTKSKVVDFYKPTLYTLTEEDTGYKNIFNQTVKPVEFPSMKEAKNFAEEYKEMPEMGICGNSDYGNQFMIELFDGKTPDYIPELIRIGMVDIEVHATDGFPDPYEAKYVINAITVFDSIEKRFITFGLEYDGCGGWNQERSDEKVKPLPVDYFGFEDEESLLRSFLQVVQERGFDVLTGWHSEGFDVPYIVNRCNKVLGESFTKKMLSPFGKIDEREVRANFGKMQTIYNFVGMPHLDYMQIYKKHTYTPRESYKLDFIGHVELGEKKLSYDEAGDLQYLYETNYQKFIDYNIRDVDIIKRLDEKLGLFNLIYAMSYYSLCNFEDTMGTVKIWEKLVAKFLYGKNVVPPFRRQKITEEREFEGAYVKEPIKGFHDWVVSYDLNSLYPHIEQQWNIGPETHVPYDELPDEVQAISDNYDFNDLLSKEADLSALEDHGLTMAANFECYRTDRMSFFSEIKRELYTQRKAYKKKMLEYKQKKVDAKDDKEKKKYEALESASNNMQMGLKILLNGGYGALGNKHFLYYKVENAEAITLSGQLVNKWTCMYIDDFLRKIFESDDTFWVYSDTDSGYFTIKPFVDTLKKMDRANLIATIEKFSDEVVQPVIEERCQELTDYMNCYEQRMFWSREIISNRAVWVGKKKYVMSVYDDEGTKYLNDPYYKIMGMESVKSSTPEWARDYLKECYRICINEGEEALQKRVDEIVEEFHSLSINDIAMPRGVNNINKWYDEDKMFISGTPKNVKAAIVHNEMLKRLNLNRIEPITDGNKIKFVELKMPNPTGVDVIGFDTYMPKEFGLDKYVNRELMLEKSFLQPLRIYLDSINFSEEEKVDLFGF